MTILWYYLIALLPLIVGGYLWYHDKRVVWYEWVGTVVVGFILAATFHFTGIHSMTKDHETWSGKITKVIHYPYWLEHYTTIETYECGTSDNPQTCTRTVDHWVHHPEYWEAKTTVEDDFRVTEPTFREIVKKFGGHLETKLEWKPNFYSGDRNIYIGHNQTKYVYPVTTWKYFENRVKAAPSLFSFTKVPEGTPVHEYPANKNFMASDRLRGISSQAIDRREFDLMNSRLGPSKKVNVIMVGFKGQDREIAHWQESKYVGGRKNDVVLCYGVGDDPKKAQWAHVFGWTEEEQCKRNLETILLENPIDNTILPKIEQEIIATYELKDWSKFDYITVEPPTWTIYVFLLALAGTQAGLWYFCLNNQACKETYNTRGGRKRKYGRYY